MLIFSRHSIVIGRFARKKPSPEANTYVCYWNHPDELGSGGVSLAYFVISDNFVVLRA